jgi:hypothetical protein
MNRPQKPGHPNIPAAPTTPERERLVATAARAKRQGQLTIAATLRPFLVAERADFSDLESSR